MFCQSESSCIQSLLVSSLQCSVMCPAYRLNLHTRCCLTATTPMVHLWRPHSIHRPLHWMLCNAPQGSIYVYIVLQFSSVMAYSQLCPSLAFLRVSSLLFFCILCLNKSISLKVRGKYFVFSLFSVISVVLVAGKMFNFLCLFSFVFLSV